jgi:hypothetical protein
VADPTDADLLDLYRTLAIIRGHETIYAPELVYTKLVMEYAKYRGRDVSHTTVMRVIAAQLARLYPDAPPLTLSA